MSKEKALERIREKLHSMENTIKNMLEEDDLVYVDMEKDKLNRQILDIDLILKNCEDY